MRVRWITAVIFVLAVLSGCTLGHRATVRDEAPVPQAPAPQPPDALIAIEEPGVMMPVASALTPAPEEEDTVAADSTDAVMPGLVQLLEASLTATDSTTAASDEAVVDITLDPDAFNIPVVLNERVKAEFRFLLRFKKFPEWLNRANRYASMMRTMFQREGLPGDLVYLSLIESGSQPRAYSRRKAAGLWQFMSTTGRERGLKQTTWIDERFDPEKATQAAVRHFKLLYRLFGDWSLVMAAHNGGPGLIQKAIRKSRTSDYWQMKLPKETMKFVPLIMAAAIIAKNPDWYGFTLQSESPLAYETVSVDRGFDLKRIAQGMDIPLDDLKMLNPELRKWRLPSSGYALKIPVGTQPKFMAWLPTAASTPVAQEATQYIVRAGDTLSAIARRYGITTRAIIAENALTRPNRLAIGQSLVIPSDERVEKDHTKHAVQVSTPVSPVTYTVRRGDTLWEIAQRFNVTVNAIRGENGLPRSAAIHPGDRLKISAQRGEIRQFGQ